MPYANLEERNAKQRIASKKYKQKNYERVNARARELRRNGGSSRQRAYKAARKIRVLTHYGPQQTLRCAWPDCKVTDIDVLTLDHINDDGAKERARLGVRTGGAFYKWLEARDFPGGFQTLCCNHQMKKHLIFVRKMADAAYDAYPKVELIGITAEERERRRLRATGVKASAKTRKKQSRSQKLRLLRPGELDRLVKLSSIAGKTLWSKMTKSETKKLRAKMSLGMKAAWARRKNAAPAKLKCLGVAGAALASDCFPIHTCRF